MVVIDNEKAEEDTLSVDYIYAVMDSTSNDSLRTVFLTQLWGESFVDSILTDPEVFKQQQQRDRLYSIEDEEEERESLVNWAKWIQEGRMPSYSDLEEEITVLKKKIKKSQRIGLAENPELKTFKVEEVDKNRFLLAELYWFRFSLMDSASAQYRCIVNDYPRSPYAPRSLYNLGYLAKHFYRDSAQTDSIYQLLINRYPRSPVANDVKRQLDLPVVMTQEDSVANAFQRAEHLLFNQNQPRKAYNAYQSLRDCYPETEWAAKAMFSMGWICEYRLDSLQLAFVLYDSLVSRYPESIYAMKVQPKVLAVRTAEQEKEKDISEKMDLKQPKILSAESDTMLSDTEKDRLSSELIPEDTLSSVISAKDTTLQVGEQKTKQRMRPDPKLLDEKIQVKTEEKAEKPEDFMME
jgi:TolA-binding protein